MESSHRCPAKRRCRVDGMGRKLPITPFVKSWTKLQPEHMHPENMFLSGVEHNHDAKGAYADLIHMVRSAGGEIAQIWYLFAFKPEATVHLERFTHAVMRGHSPLSPGLRELIAAYTSARNDCEF